MGLTFATGHSRSRGHSVHVQKADASLSESLADNREATKGRICKRVALANVPSFWLLVLSFLFLVPSFRLWVRFSFFCTLVLVLGSREHLSNR